MINDKFQGLRNLALWRDETQKSESRYQHLFCLRHIELVECKFCMERVQYCVSAVSLHYIEHNSNFCYAQSMNTADTDVAIDSTQQAAAAAAAEPYSYQMHTYIFNKTNSTIYQLKRDERESKLSVLEWHTKA